MLPLAGVFLLLSRIRRGLYRFGLLRVVRLPVPVVVIGNLSVGGVGKTPLVIALANALREAGWAPGIVSRGYGGQAEAGEARLVGLAMSAAEVGDEPLLLLRKTGVPVAVGKDRVAAAQALLAAHRQTRVILSDDGLQHYRLGRSIEVAVVNPIAEGNGWPLPAGPMRETLARLGGVDAVVWSGSALPRAPIFAAPLFGLKTVPGVPFALEEPQRRLEVRDLEGRCVHAVAGIGSPQRFFDDLRLLGIVAIEHTFPDHHAYTSADLAFDGGVILTTEKDAVKFLGLELHLPVWVLPLEVAVEPDLARFILEKLNGSAPA